ncbi:S9 family peptidase [Halobellus clavatus]|jgi:dipeptidyl aminopeptidase/acylaminoacyl peptidase|uniref:Acyl-peptide hydrolase n=1 Tax=Halobellus clavatus TaxID=660517 RepID=A0A1H3CKS2_9EURY|nr:S9 family peptidase [Halobellus clavatus]SDX54727.1 Dipeptidyl aminopeptidase/acylaminoacyl peptidase [Halobellus clavatus]
MPHDIERYLNVRSAYGASIGPEDEALAFLMDTTGVPQVWTIDEPGGWPEQRTFFDERVTFVSWSPTRREFAFGMDEGGNERAQLFRYDLADGAITNLTADPEAKHRWGGWSHDGERFAFTSNRREASVFDVYVQGRDERGSAADLITEGDGWLTLGGWSPDDSRLIVSQAYSNFDQDVSVLDVESGELTLLTPHDGTVRFQSPEWGPDGERVYLVSDRESDTLDLWCVDVETGEFALVERDPDWEIDGVAVDEETGRIAYATNVDGYTELTVGHLRAPDSAESAAPAIEEGPAPALPRGVIGGVEFDSAGDRFAVTVTQRGDPANVYVVESDAVTAVDEGSERPAERWTRAATAGIPRDTFVAPELVHYPTFDGREIPAFFSTPESDTGTDETPVIVDIHGGPESQRRPSFSAVTQYFLANGYAVFEPNVRGSAGYGKAYGHLDDVENRMDSVKDIKAAVEWLEDHPAIDPDRIVAMGGSYGGFMVLAAMTEYPDLWAAGVDIVGIANFVTFLENTGEWRRELREAEYGSLDDDRAFLESISPLNTIEEIRAPLFVIHGANDPRVPVSEAHQLVEAASEHVPVRERIFEDEGHGIAKLENRIEAYSEVVEFLREHVP